MPVEIDVASETRYRSPVLDETTLAIAISQSGETADTIAAQRVARAGGARILAVSNVMGSQLTREADATLYTRCGREIGVAATKTFTGQVVAFTLLALQLAELRGTLAPVAARRAASRDRAAARPRAQPTSPTSSPLWATDRGDRAGRVPEGLLPLHRPPPRHAGVPRGSAQAEGDQLRPDRRLPGRRDEARPDRAARRGHARRRRDERLARVRQGRLERPGGARPRRQGDRGRHRGQPGGARARRVGARDARASRPSSRRPWRSCRCRCWRTRSRACAGFRSTSRATSPRPSRSSSGRGRRSRAPGCR